MNEENNTTQMESPLSVEEIIEKIRRHCEETIAFCTEEQKQGSFFRFETDLRKRVSQLGCLFFQLFMMYCHQKLSYEQWLSSGLYYAKKNPISRVIKTVYGPVRYWRTYLERKKGGGGFYPLDAVLGLTGDGFTPLVMSTSIG